MAFFTTVIVLIIMIAFLHFNVYASVRSRIRSVEEELNHLEVRINTENDETMSEITSLEEYLSSLNSSGSASSDRSCSLQEAKNVKLAHVKRTIKDTGDELSEFEREKVAINYEIEREKEWLRQKIKTWEKAIGALSLQIDSLQMKQNKLKKNFQKYEDLTKTITIGECKDSNDDKRITLEKPEDLPLPNKNNAEKNLTFTCLDGWSLFRKHCYYTEGGKKRRLLGARKYCRKLNAYIADVESRAESNFIYSLTGLVYTLIGITDRNDDNVWISERTSQPVTYTNWLRGKPTGGEDENCVVFGFRLGRYIKWINGYCTGKYRFVCKKEAIRIK